MLLAFYILPLLFIAVSCEDQELFAFSPDKIMLAKCIESHLLNNNELYNQDGIVEKISYLTARRFFEKTLSKNAFKLRFKKFILNLKTKKISSDISRDEISAELLTAVKKALEACATKNSTEAVVRTLESKKGEVTGNDEEYFIFSYDKLSLSNCIENNLLTNNQQYRQDDFLNDFANLAAKRFYGKTVTKKSFDNRVKCFFYDLRIRQKHIAQKIQQLPHQFKLEVKQVLKDCAIDSIKVSANLSLKDLELEKTHAAVTDQDKEFFF